jgi:hypothetical protein
MQMDGTRRRSLQLQGDQPSPETYPMPNTACIPRATKLCLGFAFSFFSVDHLRVKRPQPVLRSAQTLSSAIHPFQPLPLITWRHGEFLGDERSHVFSNGLETSDQSFDPVDCHAQDPSLKEAQHDSQPNRTR